MIRKRFQTVELALFNIDGKFFARIDACGECGRPLLGGRLIAGKIGCAGCGARVQIAQADGTSDPAIYPIMVVDDEVFVWIKKTPQNEPGFQTGISYA